MEKTQHEAIYSYLREMKGWVPSYLLSKRELCGVWVGSRGERSARDLVSGDCPEGLRGRVEREIGKSLLARGKAQDAFGNPVQARYSYYRIAYDKPGTLFNVKA